MAEEKPKEKKKRSSKTPVAVTYEEDIALIQTSLAVLNNKLDKLMDYVIAEKQHKINYESDQQTAIQGKPPRQQPKKKEITSTLCACGHGLQFHDILDNYACHSMDCNCKRYYCQG